MRLLVANFFPAFTPPSSGGEQRYFHLYRHLSQWHDVTLLSATFAHDPAECVTHSPSFREYRIPKPPITDALHADLAPTGIGAECSAYVVSMAGAVGSALRDRFRALLPYADVIVHESPFTFPLDETAWRDGKPRVYASYNVEASLAGQMLAGEAGAAATRFIRFLESSLLARADLVFATSPEERATFASEYGADPARIHLAPNGFEPDGEVEPFGADESGEEREPYAVFLGSGHPPNVEAARYIIDRLAPALPGLEFRILGSVCKWIEGPVPPNVRCLGFVEESEMRRQLGRCAVALNPLFKGAGTNLKMLQYLAAGAPVLSTPVGARGLELSDGDDLLVRDGAEFASCLAGLDAEPMRWRGIGDSGKRSVYARFTWKSIAERYAAVLETLPVAVARKAARRRLLVVNDYEVAEPRGGGQMRIHALLGELAADFDIDLLCLTDAAEPSEIRMAPGVWQRAFPKTPAHRAAQAEAGGRHWISVADLVASQWIERNDAFMTAFRAALPHASAVSFEHPYLAPLATKVPPGTPVIYSSQNVETDLKRELLRGRPDGSLWISIAAELEQALAHRANAIVAVSEEDSRTFRARFPGKEVIVVENGVKFLPPVPSEARRDAPGSVASAVFMGSSHLPNITAARFIVEKLAPALPHIGFHLVGSVSECLNTNPCPTNVTCHGMVEEDEKSRILSACHMAINPMFEGGGSSLKVPDFLAAGLALVSTAVGVRGFGLSPDVDFVEADAESFADRLSELAGDGARRERIAAAGRRAIRRVAWPVVGARYRRFLRRLLRRPANAVPRLLVVTYRLMDPAPGGAESYLNHLLANLATRWPVTVDVATCDTGAIADHWHFSARYGGSTPSEVPPRGVANLHRFPIEPPSEDDFGHCRRLWSLWMRESLAQVASLFGLLDEPILLGGWNTVEGAGENLWRWSSLRAQVGVTGGCDMIRVQGTSHRDRRIRVLPADAPEASCVVSGPFVIEVPLGGARQIVEIEVDQPLLAVDDPRELGVSVSQVAVRRGEAFSCLDLRVDAEQDLRRSHPEAWIDSLIEITESRDDEADALFLKVRGPHSPALRAWLEQRVGEYDAVIIQGTPFAPIAWALPVARERGVPVALLPHFHVEDRYYHWKSYYQAFRDADCVLAAPDSIKRLFFDRIDSPSRLIQGGGITPEDYTRERLAEGRAAFERVYPSRRPFVLVLGRKTGGKRYSLILEAAAGEPGGPPAFDVVMIGPEGDGRSIDQPGVTYLGPQPREVVLGALDACTCVANMSESESFGIVILESWAAGKPVVAQRRCIAFADLVRDGENGFLADTPEKIRECVRQYLGDPQVALEHARKGGEVARRFAWSALADRAHDLIVSELVQPTPGPLPAPVFDATVFVRDAAAVTISQLEKGTVHDADFEAFRCIDASNVACILDIGANRGQSIASFRKIFPRARVHSFEANPILIPVLEEVARAAGELSTIHPYGLGPADGTFTLHVPWSGGRPWLEESSLVPEYFEKPWVAQKFVDRGGLELQSVAATIRHGDALGLSPQVVKVDVEGAENEVILGLVQTLGRCKPLLLVENSDWHRVTATLSGMGYLPFRWVAETGRLVPFHGATTNTLYLHQQAHAALVSSAQVDGVTG